MTRRVPIHHYTATKISKFQHCILIPFTSVLRSVGGRRQEQGVHQITVQASSVVCNQLLKELPSLNQLFRVRRLQSAVEGVAVPSSWGMGDPVSTLVSARAVHSWVRSPHAVGCACLMGRARRGSGGGARRRRRRS